MADQEPRQFDEHLELRDDPIAHRDAAQRMVDAMETLGFSEAARFAVRLALEEAIVNGFKHGSAGIEDPVIDLDWKADTKRITVTVSDRGPGFDPGGVPDPTQPDRLEVPTGRGLMLMKAYMSDIAYNDRGNAVTMVYDTTRPPAAGGD